MPKRKSRGARGSRLLYRAVVGLLTVASVVLLFRLWTSHHASQQFSFAPHPHVLTGKAPSQLLWRLHDVLSGPMMMLSQLTMVEDLRQFPMAFENNCSIWAQGYVCDDDKPETTSECSIKLEGAHITDAPGSDEYSLAADSPPTDLTEENADYKVRLDRVLKGPSDPSDPARVPPLFPLLASSEAQHASGLKPWVPAEDLEESNQRQVDMFENLERNTGYTGESAQRIWQAIYRDNCFAPEEAAECSAKGLFYEVLSGLHASTTLHIATAFTKTLEGSYLPNLPMLFGLLERPEHLVNIYPAFDLVDSALILLGGELLALNISQSHALMPLMTYSIIRRYTGKSEMPIVKTLQDVDSPTLEQMRARFANITRILDCVECATCRLNSKVQMLGLATAFRVLTAPADKFSALVHELTQAEWAALTQTARSFAESLSIVYRVESHVFSVTMAMAFMIMFLVTLATCSCFLFVYDLASPAVLGKSGGSKTPSARQHKARRDTAPAEQAASD